jgi:Membrane transport protein.
MQAVFNLALPFFALIFTGFLAARAKMLGSNTVGGLNTFVFYFALPALLLIETYQAPAVTGAVAALMTGYYLPGIALFLLPLSSPAARFTCARPMRLCKGSVRYSPTSVLSVCRWLFCYLAAKRPYRRLLS